jgi:lipopolysaccharide/colanic/teichoic acid biosynthesis glycosyltransferase
MWELKPDDRQDSAVNLANNSSRSRRIERQRYGDEIKRFGDILAACILIAFCLPLMAIVAVAIKLESPGPVCSRRARLTFSGRRIEILSFRTTVHEPLDASYGGLRHEQITRVGGSLRFTRIDALPQLLNVLRGEMTLFGSGQISPDILDSQ